jgi:hypothetical protein
MKCKADIRHFVFLCGKQPKNIKIRSQLIKKIKKFSQSLSYRYLPRWVHLVQKTRAKNSHAWAPLNLKFFVFQRCICGVRRAGQCVLHLLAEDEGGKRQGIQGTARPHRVRLEPKENIHRKEHNRKKSSSVEGGFSSGSGPFFPALWHRNFFLRFRFRLLKSYGSGFGSDFEKLWFRCRFVLLKSYGSGSSTISRP